MEEGRDRDRQAEIERETDHLLGEAHRGREGLGVVAEDVLEVDVEEAPLGVVVVVIIIIGRSENYKS